MNNNELNYKEFYHKKQLRAIAFGLTIACIGGIFCIVYQNFNVCATGTFSDNFSGGLLAAYFMAVFVLGLSEVTAGIITFIYNLLRGVPLAEIARTWNVNSGKTMMLSSLAAGPIGQACTLLAISMIGATYAYCIVGTFPVVTAIFGALFLKERMNKRVVIGIIIAVSGAIIACFVGAPEGGSDMTTGLIIALIAPCAFAAEGIISTHAVDVTDPMTACPLFRLCMSGIFEMAICIILALATGHGDWIGQILHLIVSTPMCIPFLICSILGMVIQYNSTYCSYNYCGATKAQALLGTTTFWTLPVGLIMSATGIMEYSVTGVAIIGAMCVVVGTLLVVAKPSELFSLRINNETDVDETDAA